MISGQTHVQRYFPKFLKLIKDGKIDPSFILTHERPLAQGPELYSTFREKKDDCIKVLFRP
jgi:threonine dehydrogenase-like Zn-dependent dehydrogenase